MGLFDPLRVPIAMRASFVVAALVVLAVAAEDGCRNACSGHGSCVKDRECQVTKEEGVSCDGQCNEEHATKPIAVCATKTPDGRCKAAGVNDCKLKCENRPYCKDFYFAQDDSGDGICTMCRDCKVKGQKAGSTGFTLKDCKDDRPVCYCEAGYTGEDCSIEVCPNNCGGHGKCDGVAGCKCDPGYGGRDCQQAPCSGHGVMSSEGTCTCHLGFKGALCETTHCPNDCNGHGKCGVKDMNAHCFCEGQWKGEDCSEVKCLGDTECSSRGTCVAGVCHCNGNYSGAACQLNCPGDCNAPYGICEYGRCMCLSGYTGEGCEQHICPDDCAGNGKCDFHTGKCICDDGFTGDNCTESTPCPKNCHGKGQCRKNDKGQFYCQCNDARYSGDCSTLACPGTPVCSSNGLCRNGTCFCDTGYTGLACEQPTCPKGAIDGVECSGRQGNCVAGKCECSPGFSGHDCSIICPALCRKHGTCVNAPGQPLICNCSDGWKGDQCQSRTCDHKCHNYGECSLNKETGHDTCVCNVGWSGPSCGISTCPEHGGQVCAGHGVCANTAMGQHCECHDGYSGISCLKRTCKNECSGYGVCKEGVCKCDVSHEGEDCGITVL